jgi:predicted nuclease of predicted toxin-antitoxin system
MKLLLDSCIWYGVRDALIDIGYDVVWVGEWESDPGDEEILAIAYRQGRILITQDKDFGEMTIVRGLPHAGILRLVNLMTTQQSQVCLQVLSRYGDELITGAIITTALGRVRIRSAENS